jgi:TolB-like protein
MSSVSPPADDSPEQFNLGAMLLIVMAAVVGTTLTVWAFHFMRMEPSVAAISKPIPRIAVLPFHSLSTSLEDMNSDEKLTLDVVNQLARISHVEALPAETDADPVLVGRALAVKILLIGKVLRTGDKLRVDVQLVSAVDGKQVWIGSFNGNSKDLVGLSVRINNAIAADLTALLD